MLVALNNMYDFEDKIQNLKPTIRIDYFQRNFLNLNLNFLDMGGQRKYREQYLKYSHYFIDLNGFIYLIDIQDEKRYIESIDYLEKVLEILSEKKLMDISHPINICFSKADGEFLSGVETEDKDNSEMLMHLIKKRFPHLSVYFHYSSIYSIFTISHLISRVLSQINHHQQLFSEVMTNFIQEFQIPYISLFDDSGLIVNEEFLKTSDSAIKNLNYDSIISNHLSFSGILKDHKIDLLKNISIDDKLTNNQYQFNLKVQNEITKTFKLKKFFLSLILDKNSNLEYAERLELLLDRVKEKINELISPTS